MQLFVSLQCTDVAFAREVAQEYSLLGLDGVAMSGMVPRLKDLPSVLAIVNAIRTEIGDEMPLHVFGVGKPELLVQVWAAGEDLCASSSCVKAAAEGRSWIGMGETLEEPAETDRLRLSLENLSAACRNPLPATFPA